VEEGGGGDDDDETNEGGDDGGDEPRAGPSGQVKEDHDGESHLYKIHAKMGSFLRK
jgi:hypothetical protein